MPDRSSKFLDEYTKTFVAPLENGHEVVLDDCEISLVHSEGRLRARSQLLLRTAPKPQVCFSAKFNLNEQAIHFEEERRADPQWPSKLEIAGRQVDVALIDLKQRLEARELILEMVPSVLPYPGCNNRDAKLHSVAAMLFNLDLAASHIGRETCLISNTWNVRLRSLQVSADIAAFRREGRYIPTHALTLTRSDSALFSKEAAKDALDATRAFLYFISGRRVRPVCPVGYDKDGGKVWSQWVGPDHCLTFGWSLFPAGFEESAKLLFPRFMEKWADEGWRDTLKFAIEGYIGCNHPSLNLSHVPILAQAALERLSSEHLFKGCRKARRTFEEKKGSSPHIRVEQLLRDFSIPTKLIGLDVSISDALKKANLGNKNLSGHEGPAVIAKVRNGAVHGDRVKYSPEVSVAVSKLALWYVEMAILAVCRYHGEYSCRSNGARERVPRKGCRNNVTFH